MLGRRRRRWPSIETTLDEYLVFAGITPETFCYPANTRHSPNAVSMLAHRLRRRLDIETALGECPVFAG